jgi:hypothetical protein
LIADFPCPTVVRGIQVAVLFDECLGFSGAGDRCGEGNEAAFANLFAVFAKTTEGKGIGVLNSRSQAAALEDDTDQVVAGVFHVLLGQRLRPLTRQIWVAKSA